jgi:hypothetical protein
MSGDLVPQGRYKKIKKIHIKDAEGNLNKIKKLLIKKNSYLE